VLSGCGSSAKKKTSTDGVSDAIWAGVRVSPANQRFLVEHFNALLASRKRAASPTELALEFIGADRTDAARVTTEAASSPEGGGPTTVTVLQDGLADDSVRAVRHVLRFVPKGDGWRLESAVRTQRCHQGRGHQAFIAADCV
jgi:hypothetical protein